MTPEAIKARKAAGLHATTTDVAWLLELCEALARGLDGLEPVDFACAVCRAEEEHAPGCAVSLAEAVLRPVPGGRWRVAP